MQDLKGPRWLELFEEEDLSFLKRFLFASGFVAGLPRAPLSLRASLRRARRLLFVLGVGYFLHLPYASVWKTLAAANQDAKIVLTLRDPEAWYASAAATIFARMLEFEALRADPSAVDPARRQHMEMVNAIVVEKTFGGSLAKDHAIGVFNAHNEEVRRSVPPGRLLVHESGEGWERLCAFLGLPVPSAPYPALNTTGDFLSRFPVKR